MVLTCIKTGQHLVQTLESIFTSAATAKQPVTVFILTQIPAEVASTIPKDPTCRVPVRIVPMEGSTGIMLRFDRFLYAYEAADDDEIYVFSNDDVIFARDFIPKLIEIPLDDRIVGPMIRTPNGSWQASLFRKRFSFLRLMFRIHDGGLYSKFFPFAAPIEKINYDRFTVDACCFVMTERTLRRFGRQFDFVSFIYMEEVLFQFLHDRLNIRSEVNANLLITHLGGASLPHKWSAERSKRQLESLTAVSSTYLNHTKWQTLGLRSWFKLEGLVRRVISRDWA